MKNFIIIAITQLILLSSCSYNRLEAGITFPKPESIPSFQENDSSRILIYTCRTIGDDAEKKCEWENLLASETLYILVDAWDEEPGAPPSKRWQNIAKTLADMRRAGAYVLHASSDSTFGYEKHRKFHKEVKDSLGSDYCKPEYAYGNAARKKIYSYANSELENCDLSEASRHKIIPAVQPDLNRENDLFAYHKDDFFYLLWKHKIKNLIYVGNSIGACLEYRPFGLRSIKSHDLDHPKLNIIIVADQVGVTAAWPTFGESKVEAELYRNSILHFISTQFKISYGDQILFSK